MKTLEYNSGGWINKILNKFPFLLDTEAIKPLFAICFNPFNKSWIVFSNEKTESLYYNGLFYLRIMFPFWVGTQIRWAGKNPTKKEYLHIGLGWKLNGRFAIHLRVLSDASSSKGVNGPNVGQAWGWSDGTK